MYYRITGQRAICIATHARYAISIAKRRGLANVAPKIFATNFLFKHVLYTFLFKPVLAPILRDSEQLAHTLFTEGDKTSILSLGKKNQTPSWPLAVVSQTALSVHQGDKSVTGNVWQSIS